MENVSPYEIVDMDTVYSLGNRTKATFRNGETVDICEVVKYGRRALSAVFAADFGSGAALSFDVRDHGWGDDAVGFPPVHEVAQRVGTTFDSREGFLVRMVVLSRSGFR